MTLAPAFGVTTEGHRVQKQSTVTVSRYVAEIAVTFATCGDTTNVAVIHRIATRFSMKCKHMETESP
jgi:hypothetical protein